MRFLEPEERIPDFELLIQRIDENSNPFPSKFHEGIVSPCRAMQAKILGERQELPDE
jgi:hypothetical protein